MLPLRWVVKILYIDMWYVIFVNFAENGHFGCDQHCPFCEWAKKDYGEYYYPSDEDLHKLLQMNDRGICQLSGGGDPLYHYEKNRDKIKHIADVVHSYNKKLQILTHKVDDVLKYFDELKEYVDDWYFSVGDKPSDSLKELSKLLDKNIRVNIVVNLTRDETVDLDRIDNIYNSYTPYVKHIAFRENFINNLEQQECEKIKNIIDEKYPHVSFLQYVDFKVLFNGEIISGLELDKKYLF